MYDISSKYLLQTIHRRILSVFLSKSTKFVDGDTLLGGDGLVITVRVTGVGFFLELVHSGHKLVNNKSLKLRLQTIHGRILSVL